MAALMAVGTNVGLSKMSDSTPGISYKQIANAAQWRLYDDAMKKAQATLVNYHHKLFLSNFALFLVFLLIIRYSISNSVLFTKSHCSLKGLFISETILDALSKAD